MKRSSTRKASVSPNPDLPQLDIECFRRPDLRQLRLTRESADYLVDRYSERKESAEALSQRVHLPGI